MTDRWHPRWDGPMSQRIVLVVLRGFGVLASFATLAWLLGWSWWEALLAVGSALVCVGSVAALVVERRERRREG